MSCGRVVNEGEKTLHRLGLPATQAKSVWAKHRADKVRVAQAWELLPRCGYCGCFVSPRNPTCRAKQCPKRGTQVARPRPWPPANTVIFRTRIKVQAVRQALAELGPADVAAAVTQAKREAQPQKAPTTGVVEVGKVAATLEEAFSVGREALGDGATLYERNRAGVVAALSHAGWDGKQGDIWEVASSFEDPLADLPATTSVATVATEMGRALRQRSPRDQQAVIDYEPQSPLPSCFRIPAAPDGVMLQKAIDEMSRELEDERSPHNLASRIRRVSQSIKVLLRRMQAVCLLCGSGALTFPKIEQAIALTRKDLRILEASARYELKRARSMLRDRAVRHAETLRLVADQMPDLRDCWRGMACEPGSPILSDQSIVLKADHLDDRLREKLTETRSAANELTIPTSQLQRYFDAVVGSPQDQGEVLGVTTIAGRDYGHVAVGDTTYTVDGERLCFVNAATGYDRVGIATVGDATGRTQSVAVLYREQDPVALLPVLPTTGKSAFDLDVPTARRAIAELVRVKPGRIAGTKKDIARGVQPRT